MAVGYFIRVGDKTTCGGSVLEGEREVTLGSLFRAREGDLVSCGVTYAAYPIRGGIAHLKSGGRRVAGSMDSRSDCPCGARLIPSFLNIHYHSAHPQKCSPSRTADRGLAAKPRKPHQMRWIAAYMASQMNNNVRDARVRQLALLNSYDLSAETSRYTARPWFAKCWTRHPRVLARRHQAAALKLWNECFGSDSSWNYAAQLARRSGGPWLENDAYQFHQRIWVGIHYGYVGMAAGFSARALLDGDQLDLAAILGPINAPYKPVTTMEHALQRGVDAADRLAIDIGVQLYKSPGPGLLTAQHLMERILAPDHQQWGAARRTL